MLEITNDRTKKIFFVGLTTKFIVLSDTFCKLLRDFVFFLFLGSLQNAQRDTVNLAVIESFRSEFTANL